jgi:phosphoglycerol transferase MdoB-like AlkP superfamily enzyme
MFTKDYIVLFKRVLFAFGFYTFYRAVFYFYNYKYFEPFGLGETIFAFLYGLRFDLATVLIANLIFIVASLLPLSSYKFHVFKKTLFVAFNAVFLGFIIVDLEFFTFLGKKMTVDIFVGGMAGDIVQQIVQLTFYYWYLSSLVITTTIILWKFYPRRKRDVLMMPPIAWYKVAPISFLLFVMTAVGIRGGLQMRSISPKEAFIHEAYELGNLSLNAAYTLVRSINKKTTPVEKYYKSDSEALALIRSNRDFSQGIQGPSKDNVIILIIESFSQEYIEAGLTPFFNSLKEKGLSFEFNFANGRRSMEALPSIMTGMPSIVGQPIYQSQFQANQYFALPKILREYDYQTEFFHGGKRGTMDFDAYCYSIGFEKYHALEDYPHQEHFDGHWGVYDHYYLKYFADKLDEFKTPFFTSLFTLSSHQPYSIPQEYQNKYPKGSLEIHESIGYVDQALKEFFEYAKSKAWYQNTLFIITADHTSKLESSKFSNFTGRYRVPLLFYHPYKEFPAANPKRITQHADILPSVLDFVGIDYPKKLHYGTSVFNQDEGRVINFNSGNYVMIKRPYVLRFDKTRSILFKLDDSMSQPVSIENSEVLRPMLQELKAYIQYTNNGLRNNNIYNIR